MSGAPKISARDLPGAVPIPKERVFTDEEFAARLKAVRMSMDARGLDVLIVFNPSSIYYLTGHHSMNLWDYQCLVVPLTGDPVFVLWEFELGRFEASCRQAVPELYPAFADPVALTGTVVARLVKSGRVGVELKSHFLLSHQYLQLRDALSQFEVVDGSWLVEDVRLVKSPAELAIMRETAALTDKGMRAAYAAVKEGVPDSAPAAAAAETMIAGGSLPFAIHPIVASGYRSGTPHSTYDGRALKRGETVFLELSANLRWYNAPIMRTAVVGEILPEVAHLSELGKAMAAAMITAMRPGATASSVAKAGADVINPVRGNIVFHDTYGYAVGIGFPPTWLEDGGFFLSLVNHRPLAEDMVFHLPLSLRLKGRCGVGSSQTVRVTPSGGEVLSKVSLDLFVG